MQESENMGFQNITLPKQHGALVYLERARGALSYSVQSLMGSLTLMLFLIAFFLGFGDEKLAPMFSISRYISMVLGMTLASGLVFELPLVVLFLAKLDLITSTDLRKRRGYAVVMIFVIAAVLSPPDVFSQLLLALPLIGLYELSILLTRIIFR